MYKEKVSLSTSKRPLKKWMTILFVVRYDVNLRFNHWDPCATVHWYTQIKIKNYTKLGKSPKNFGKALLTYYTKKENHLKKEDNKILQQEWGRQTTWVTIQGIPIEFIIYQRKGIATFCSLLEREAKWWFTERNVFQ